MVSGKTVSLRVFSVLFKGAVVWTVEFTISTTISGWVVEGGAFGFAHSRFDKSVEIVDTITLIWLRSGRYQFIYLQREQVK